MLVKPDITSSANIKVVGVGGGGTNAINTMIADYKIEGVEFIAINTDAQALKNSLAPIKIQIGPELTRGLGAGGDPTIGSKAAEESIDELHDALAGADMVFVTGGLGGGTGTGAIPVIGGIAQNIGALSVAVVTKPFNFEMKKRMELAVEGVSRLKDNVDTMIIVPNQRVLDIVDKSFTFVDAMKKVDEVLANAVSSISGLVTQTGFINLDFADVRTIMRGAGTAMMGMGHGSGETRAEQAARQAINSPLLEMSIDGAKGVLFNIRGGLNLTMHEVDVAASLINGLVDPSAIVKFGAYVDESLGDEIQITVLAAGFEYDPQAMMNMTPHSSTAAAAAAGAISSSTTSASSSQSSVADDDYTNNKPPVNVPGPGAGDDELDIPAFLRKN